MKANDKLLILTRNSERYAELFREQAFQNLDIFFCDCTDDAQQHISDCNIILGEPVLVAEVVNATRRLQWVQTTFAGVEALMWPGIRKDYLP